MDNLKGARVALLEARMTGEMADLVRRYDGNPYSVPAVREVPLEGGEQIETFIDALIQKKLNIVVFFTGVGVNTLLREAERLGQLPSVLSVLRDITIICRGPKPASVLRRNEIPIAASAVEPYTTYELVAAIAPFEVQNINVGVVHYGERNEFLLEELQKRGAIVTEVCLYEWLLPPDISGLQELIRDLLVGHVDAIVFTSQIQARHLLLIAQEMGVAEELKQALNNKTIVASVGPTCTAVLQQLGVTPHVEPEHPKMGHLMKTLAHYYSER
jgi:uroporphyrinogen-III synthase